ncbi:MAG TPA: tetratricopeptide repeat protein [Verrucomicrobiae bacterium]|nr:tetratricopeptide repeat protein [Verrucomicrobiae bacterium]
MNPKLFFSVLAATIFSARIFAADTNLISPEAATTATQNALLQIQEQLHAAQLAISDSREQAEVAAATNVAVLTARIQALEQTIATQRANDAEAARKTQELTLLMAGAFGLAGLSVILLMFYFQWRGFSHLAEISSRQLALADSRRSSALVGAATELTAEISAPARAAVENSNSRLLMLVEKLEKRVVEMEQSSHGQLTDAVSKTKSANGKCGPEDAIANLLADGQTLLNASQPENALKLFEQALAINPDSTEALVKKGGALEKLGRIDDAIGCYDRAIQLNETMTIAYLQKGGLFSRLARYDEALLCYEQALLTQDKAPLGKN